MKNNPYVGPRPYERGDRHFYGRAREARDLLSLILAEPVVLFYAASGAGKTSLLNAKIIPGLEAEGFQVLDPTRVGSGLPPAVDPQDVDNVFVFSALMGLAGEDVPAESLKDHTLLSFLRQMGLGEGAHEAEAWTLDTRPPILIFDQFEELFTTHRERWQDARSFFEQVREALHGMPTLGVVFAMREDHVAELYPYAHHLPGWLRTRFRMERLDPEGALAAVRRPAEDAGCPFEPGVAERLVDDLRGIKRAGETRGERAGAPFLGPYVEPVQLQVVCSRLWENLPEQEDNAIQWEEIEAFGDVDRALTDFYEETLDTVVQRTALNERTLRRWFSKRLITPMETRGLVLREKTETAGLPNEAVDILEAQHVIRADRRAGARWYELSHDRLVDPIIRANEDWQRRHPLIQAALEWREAGEPASSLYQGERLEAAWEEPDASVDVVQAFLSAGRQAQEAREAEIRAEEEQKRREAEIRAEEQAEANRRLRWLVMGLAAVFVLAMGAAIVARSASRRAEENAKLAATRAAEADAQRLEAEHQAQIALAQSLAGGAPHTNNDDELTTLLAVEALNVVGGSPGPAWSLIHRALADVLWKPVFNHTLRGHEDSIRSVAFGPDGRWLASGSRDTTLRVWDVSALLNTGLEDPSAAARVLSGHEGGVLSVAFSPDGRWLASGSSDQTVRVWDVSALLNTGLEDRSAAARVLSGHEDSVMSVAFSPDGRWLASGSSDETVRVRATLEWLAEIGCQTVFRNMTREEWELYLPGEPYRATCPNRPVPEE